LTSLLGSYGWHGQFYDRRKPEIIFAAPAQVTDTKNFAAARVGLQIAIENFRHKAEA
jgi:hypothetical protein